MAFYPREALNDREMQLFRRKVVFVVGAAILLALFWAVRDVLILVAIAAVLAAGIAPAVHRVRILGRLWLHRNIPRGTAVLIVYFPFLFLAILLLVLMVPRLIADSRELGAQLPLMIEQNVLTPLQKYIPMDAVRNAMRNGISLPRASMFNYARTAVTATVA